ncbi:MAG: OmpH family outer membrane protein [Ignavibacteria bacterium]|jgi:outer membrane protein|nr:OmpH family outer membrane protein [Ignavibacteria bacterium]
MKSSFFRNSAILGVFIFFLIGFSTQNKALANNTIAVVDIEAIVKEMPEAIEADKQLKDISQKYQDSLTKMQKDLEAKAQNYQKQKSMMAADKQQQEEEKLQKEYQTLAMFQQEKFSNTGELVQMREKYLEPIRLKVKNAIEAVAKDEKVGLVLSKDAAIVMFADAKLDITFRVIDKIKREK